MALSLGVSAPRLATIDPGTECKAKDAEAGSASEQACDSADMRRTMTPFVPLRDKEEALEQPETWDLLNEELRHRLDVQRAAAQRLETKATVIIGAALAGVQFIAKEPFRSYWLPLAVGSYLAAIGAGLLAVLPQVFHETGPRPMLIGLWLYPRGRAAAELANNRLAAYEMNVKRHGRRVAAVRVSVVALVLAAILSVAHLTQGARTVSDKPQEPAPPVPQAAAPPPDLPPQPAQPTMNLLESETKALTASGAPVERRRQK